MVTEKGGVVEMQSSYLIQRLEAPNMFSNRFRPFQESDFTKKPFDGVTFGEHAIEIRKSLFQYDYMGAAEFEFGALPQTMYKIWEEREQYISFSMELEWKYFDFGSNRRDKIKRPSGNVYGKRQVWVICKPEWKEEVKRRFEDLAMDRTTVRTKMAANVGEGLGDREFQKNLIGWFEIDNGYFVFKDKQVFKNACIALGIKCSTQIN